MRPKLPLSYCAEEVRMRDPDRYLCSLFAPAQLREAWFALFAFHAELRDIPHKVSEDMIGFIRFAWWREALDEIYSGKTPRQHPVVEALGHVARHHALPRAPLDTLLDAHEKSLLREEFADMAQAEEFCRATGGALGEACGHVAEGSAQTYIGMGTAWALMELARKTGKNAEAAVSQAHIIEIACRYLGEAKAELDRNGYVMPFLTACDFYLKRLRHGKSTAGPWVKVRLGIRLWLSH